MNDRLTILTGDCRDTLPTLAAGSVHCVVTSPPYYGLRDYGTAEWIGSDDPNCDHIQAEIRTGMGLAALGEKYRGGGHKQGKVTGIPFKSSCPLCGAKRVDRQIGQEDSPEEYIQALVQVFREVRRVLRDDGTLWVNIGDSYANDTKWGGHTSGKHAKALHADGSIGRCRHLTGLPGKNLMGIPWRLAFALQADGWILRQDIIWSKPNPMPESVTDRCTKSHEYIFLFSKSARYFYDAVAIREPVAPSLAGRVRAEAIGGKSHVERGQHSEGGTYFRGEPTAEYMPMPGFEDVGPEREPGVRPSVERGGFNGKTEAMPGCNAFRAVVDERNKRSVWTVATQPYAEAHFATFPADLIRPCILAGCPSSGKHCDCDEIILTPTGEGEIDDPSLTVGRAGMSRPRRENGGTRAITRREQRSDAKQMKKSPYRLAMANICGPAFEHYIRTDDIGARPLPADIRTDFFARGWITMAPPCSCPIQPAGTVLDPFGGSGTTGKVAIELGRCVILCELNPKYVPMIRRRCDTTPGFDFTATHP